MPKKVQKKDAFDQTVAEATDGRVVQNDLLEACPSHTVDKGTRKGGTAEAKSPSLRI